MSPWQLQKTIEAKKSFLSVGLDPDPKYLQTTDPASIVRFCKKVVDETREYCVSYKVNFAYFEALGRYGWDALYQVREYLPDDALLIADAKRGDIGHTSAQYAKAILEELAFDAITLQPYLGGEALQPFLDYDDKWVIVLAATSNRGAGEFQALEINGEQLYLKVAKAATGWAGAAYRMLVTGATEPERIQAIRQATPEAWLLIPGVGAQGGSLHSVVEAANYRNLLVPISRSIIYAEDIGLAASQLQEEMKSLLR